MPLAKIAALPDRAVIRLSGADAEKLLQGVITNDVELLTKQPAIFAGLLTPQGKILAEFFVVKTADGFLLEIARAQAAELVKRLTLYRLRAKVDIRDVTGEYIVFAAWSEGVISVGAMQGTVSFPDPRLATIGLRVLADAQFADDIVAVTDKANATPADYQAHRIALGVPEGGKDYAFGDIFPHEANFDLLDGISFTKGCFVGQEVVSRMQHRGTARKRIVIVEGDASLTSGAQLTAGPAAIGMVGSVAGSRGLALLRLDRAEEAKAKGDALAAGGSKVVVSLPGYMTAPAGAS